MPIEISPSWSSIGHEVPNLVILQSSVSFPLVSHIAYKFDLFILKIMSVISIGIIELVKLNLYIYGLKLKLYIYDSKSHLPFCNWPATIV